MRRVIVCATFAVALLVAPAAQARQYELMTSVPGAIRTAARKAKIPVRVPASLPLDYDRGIYGQGGGNRRTFFVGINATKACGGNACFLASITGEKGGKPAFRRRVSLARGITGYFKPLSCGASCAPPEIQWIQGRVLYAIQAKVVGNGRRVLIRAANEAIRAKAL